METETLQTLDLNNNRFAIDPLVVAVQQKMQGWTTNVEGKVNVYHYKNCLEVQLVNKNILAGCLLFFVITVLLNGVP